MQIDGFQRRQIDAQVLRHLEGYDSRSQQSTDLFSAQDDVLMMLHCLGVTGKGFDADLAIAGDDRLKDWSRRRFNHAKDRISILLYSIGDRTPSSHNIQLVRDSVRRITD